MKNTLKNLLVAGTLGLVVAGCKDENVREEIRWDYGQYAVTSSLGKNCPDSRPRRVLVTYYASPSELYLIRAKDLNCDSTFETISLNGVDATRLREFRSSFDRNFYYYEEDVKGINQWPRRISGSNVKEAYKLTNAKSLKKLHNELLGITGRTK